MLKDVASKGLSKADIARGKAQLKLSVLVAAESAETIIEDMGAQVRQGESFFVFFFFGGEGGACFMEYEGCLVRVCDVIFWGGRGICSKGAGRKDGIGK